MMGDDAFETLLDYLKAARSFDFTGYKRASLKRRVDKRLHAVSVDSYEDYKDYLEVHPEEFAILFDTILINVTSFFRDAPMWDHLATEIVPQTAERLGDGAFRIWSAGCASGEEAYTIAIVVAEALGESTLRDRVKIFATDIDEDALTHARHGEYDASAISPVPVPIRERYFEQLGDRYAFRKDLRRSVIFGRNDLMQDAPSRGSTCLSVGTR